MSSESQASKDKSTSAAAPAGQGERQPAALRYVDRTDLAETFTDSSTTSDSMARRCALNSASHASMTLRSVRRLPVGAILPAGLC